MIRRSLPALLMLLFLLSGKAQKHVKTPERAVRFLADKVLETTSFELINTKSGETYANSEGVPLSGNVKLKSKYLDWHYEIGVLRMAILRMSEILEDPKYAHYVRQSYNYSFDQLDYFKQLYDDPEVKKPSLYRYFKMDMLDNCGTMGAALIEIYKEEKDKRYKSYIDQADDYILNKEYRLDDGTFVRDHPIEMTLWGDDLYMGCIFLIKMGEWTGDQKYFDDAANQVINFTQYLYDKEAGLYNHAKIIPTGDLTPAFWGRANGWILMAQTELLAALPKDHPKRAQLLDIFRQHVKSIIRYQDASGRWHQVINREGSYEESSCSAMYTYCIARAVNEGWITELYSYTALMGWEGLKEKITEDAQVTDICVGTHVELNAPFYYNRPKSVNDTHGLAATLLAGTEIHRLMEKMKE